MIRLFLYCEEHKARSPSIDWAKCVLEDEKDAAGQPLLLEWNHFADKWDDNPVETSDPLHEVNLGTKEVQKNNLRK